MNNEDLKKLLERMERMSYDDLVMQRKYLRENYINDAEYRKKFTESQYIFLLGYHNRLIREKKKIIMEDQKKWNEDLLRIETASKKLYEYLNSTKNL